MRVLITIKPLMYREALALALRRERPHFEVMLGPTASLNGQAESFRPHMLIRNDTDGVDMDLMQGIRCWIEILYSDGMDARVSLDGEIWNIKDISTEDLLELVDRTENLMLEGTPLG